MGLLGRFFSERDLKLIASINGELSGDIVQTEVFIFKICAAEIRRVEYFIGENQYGINT